jgi:hypothetical protein
MAGEPHLLVSFLLNYIKIYLFKFICFPLRIRGCSLPARSSEATKWIQITGVLVLTPGVAFSL